MGVKTDNLLKRLMAPHLRTVVETHNTLSNYHNLKPVMAVKRGRFNSAYLASGEKVTQGLVRLKKLSVNCGFRVSLEEALRDRCVVGVYAELENQLTYDNLVMDIAQRNAQVEFGLHKDIMSVNDAQYCKKVFTTQTCSRCSDYHSSDECRFKYSECHFCGKLAEISVLAERDKAIKSVRRLKLVKPAQDNMKGRYIHKNRCTVSKTYVKTL